MKKQEIEQDKRKIITKINKLKKEEQELNKKLKKIEKEEKEKRENLEGKFYDIVDKMYNDCWTEGIEYLYGDWGNDEGCDQEMIKNLTEEHTDFAYIWNWEENIDEKIEWAEGDSKSHTEHVRALKEFKEKFKEEVEKSE